MPSSFPLTLLLLSAHAVSLCLAVTTSTDTPSATVSAQASATNSSNSSPSSSSTGAQMPSQTQTLTPSHSSSTTLSASASALSPTLSTTATPSSTATLAPCPGGSFYNETLALLGGFPNPKGYCTACPPGTWSGVGAVASCTACAAGRYNPTNSSSSPSACRECPLGSACPSGSVSPAACPQDYFCPDPASAPVPCDAGYDSRGTVSNTAKGQCRACQLGYSTNGLLGTPCKACSPGTRTFFLGMPSCASIYNTCDPGKQPKMPGITQTLDPSTDCVPLACPSGFAPGPSNSTCIAQAPLPPPLAFPAALLQAAPPPCAFCLPASLLPLNSIPPSLQTSFAGSFTGKASPWDLLAYLAIFLPAAGLVAYGVQRVRSEPTCFRKLDFVARIQEVEVPGRLKHLRNENICKESDCPNEATEAQYCKEHKRSAKRAACCHADLFESCRCFKRDPGDEPPAALNKMESKERRTALGGLCSYLFTIALAVLSVWSVLTYLYDNTQSSSAPELLGSAFNASNWAPGSSPIATALGATFPPSTVTQLRIFGQRELGCAAPAPFVTQDSALPPAQFAVAPGEKWVLDLGAPGASSGGGGQRGLSLFTLSCISCKLTPASFASFYLNFSCQAFFVE